MKTSKKVSGKPTNKSGKKGVSVQKPIFKAKNNPGGKKSRKDLRKEKRQAKKQRQQQHVLNKSGKGNKKVEDSSASSESFAAKENNSIKLQATNKTPKSINKGLKRKAEDSKEGPPQNLIVVKKRLEKEMQSERMKQLKMANKEEDKNIKRLAKQLKINRRKSKSMPKVFATEGLDYLLDVCDPEKLKLLSKDKDALESSGSEFEDDFAEVTGLKKKKKANTKNEDNLDMSEDSEDPSESEADNESMFSESEDGSSEGAEGSLGDFNLESELSDDEEAPEYPSSQGDKKSKKKCLDSKNIDDNEPIKLTKKANSKKQVRFDDEATASNIAKAKNVSVQKLTKKSQKELTEAIKSDDLEGGSSDEQFSEDGFGSDGNDSDEGHSEHSDEDDQKEDSNYWEDIYGRKRDKKGNVVQENAGRYVPPALRAGGNTDKAKLMRLKRQMQGLLNRVAESNMGNVSSQLEEVITAHSRGDCNEVMGQLLLAVLVQSHSMTPTKLAAEHALLLALLHAHIGVEIGATFLQTTVTAFNNAYSINDDIEDKTLNNLLLITCYMYSFKMFNCVLVFDILKKLCVEFKEKDVELIMLILKSVGPFLRKDDPVALKEVILQLQKQASAATQHKENTRVRFMLDILLAIKNNNMSRIPDYDPELIEHLRKVLRGLLRPGSQVSELKISLEDLLMAEERGRWWVVGSAWQGLGPGANDPEEQTSSNPNFSQQLLELARKQRMNTDVRRNIFCILMTAEDFLDAFEKLLRLGLKGSQEREISYVLLDCCLQEKSYNPYYGHLAQKFCDFDRKYRMSLQCSVWDKIKVLSKLSSQQLRNLASVVSQLILSNGLTLSVLKVIQFADLEKVSVKFVRQILLGLLLAKDAEASSAVFYRIPSTDQLALFRESLSIFLHRYVLSKKHQLPDGADIELLSSRVSVAEKALTNADSRVTM